MFAGQTWAFTVDGLNYSVTNSAKRYVSVGKGSTNPTGALEIPATVENEGVSYIVTSIPNYAFYMCSGITSVSIPNTITDINSSAFDVCSKIENFNVASDNTMYSSENGIIFNKDKTTIVRFPEGKKYSTYTIPNGVEKIGNGAFHGCKMTSVIIPNSVTSIGSRAFYCSELTSITIPNSVTSIESQAFLGTNLTSITIPNSITSIGSSVFFQCDNLTSVTIPNSVTSIGSSAFQYCYNLKSITIPSSVTRIDNGAFSGCNRLTSINIPDGVTSIGESVFSGCIKLTSITIPDGVTSIGEKAFYSCKGLTSIIIPNSVTSIGKDAFSGCNNQIFNPYDNAYYLGTSENLYQYLIKAQSTTITGCEINSNCKIIGGGAFSGCNNITSITIPNSVTNIGSYALYGCCGLTSVTIPNEVTRIGNYAFYRIKNIIYFGSASGKPWGALTVNGIIDGDFIYSDNAKTKITAYIGVGGDVNIPNIVTNIGGSAFYNCSSLTLVTIPNSVKNIGGSAFEGCSNATLYCEVEETSKPSGWYSSWNYSNRPVKWGCRVVSAPPYYAVHVEASITGENYELIDNTGALWFLKDAIEPTVTVTFNLDRGYHWSDRKSRVPYIITEPVTASKTYISNDKAVTCEACRVFDAAVAPTCTETGLTLGAHCSVCGNVLMAQDVVPINSSNHNYGAPTYEWSEGNLTCTATKACTYNSEHNITETVDATSAVTVAPTCEAVGTRTFSAEFTSEDFAAQQTTEEIAATGHTYSNTITAPTCIAVGFTTHTCSVCEHTYNSDTIAAKGHKADSVEFENIIPATCTEAGSKDSVVYCSVCHDKLSSTTLAIKANGHTVVVDAAVPATTTSVGKTEGSHCSVCNTVLVAQEDIPMLANNGGDNQGGNNGNENNGGGSNNQGENENQGGEKNQQEGNENQGSNGGNPATAVADAAASSLNIYAHHNIIVVENAADEILVYDAMGKLVGRARRDAARHVSTTGTTAITVTTQGVYIVKVGNTVKRVMVN